MGERGGGGARAGAVWLEVAYGGTEARAAPSRPTTPLTAVCQEVFPVLPALLLLLSACGGTNTYVVQGTVREVRSPTEVVVAHEAIAGLMGPMVMPFQIAEPAEVVGLKPGDRIRARLEIVDGGRLTQVEVVGHDAALDVAPSKGIAAPIHSGSVFPRTEVPVGAETWIVGAGQDLPTILTFLYTTCRMPEFCPATTRRLQELQPLVQGKARLLAITIDPAGDSPDVLQRFAADVGADPAVWRFGRLEGAALDAVAMSAGLTVLPGAGEIEHSVRFLVLAKDGRLVERYDDSRFPAQRLVEQLLTGGPTPATGSSGTASPAR